MSKNLIQIKSHYNLKTIFSIINYDRVLKLIKYNKKLQTSLGLNIQFYQQRSNFQYLHRQRSIKKDTIINDPIYSIMIYCPSTLLTLILFIYVLVFSSLLASKGAFDEENTQTNYDENISDIIDKINLSLFGFLAYIIVSYFIFFIWAFNDCHRDFGLTLVIKRIVIILIEILYLLYDIVIIVKLAYSYKIKKDKTTWFMVCDYILIILISVYFAFLIPYIRGFFIHSGTVVIKIPEANILTKFRDIKINDFLLSADFENVNDYEKRNYVLNNKNNYKIKTSQKQKDLIYSINQFRIENNIDRLTYNEIINFKDIIFDNYSEPIFYDYENIFKFSNGNYLLKYPINDFETRFKNKENNIVQILLNYYLDKIIIIEKDNFEYIFLFQSDYKPPYSNEMSEMVELIE